MADLEEGVGSLFASFEKGILDIVDAESAKGRAAVSNKARAPGDGDVDAVVDAVVDVDAGAHGTNDELVAEPHERPDRVPMTYDDALQPIKWRSVIIGLLCVVMLAALYWGATLVQVYTAANDEQARPVDAIVVLGAAQFDGTPSPALAARLDRARELFEDGVADTIVTTGSNREGDRFTEGFSGFVYLRDAGVPEEAIVTITNGGDTYRQITATKVQLDERDLTTALLVSDRYHSYRLRSIAEDVGIEAYVAPTSIEPTTRDYVRETTAVSIGRIVGYRRLSNWAADPEVAD